MCLYPEKTGILLSGVMILKKKIMIAATVAVIAAGLLMVWLLDIPNWKKLDTQLMEHLQNASIVYDKDGNEAFSLYGSQRRRLVSVDMLPVYVPQAFVAAEDQRFYAHHGIDLRRIFGAALANLRSGELAEGASTITQQLIKLTHLSPEKTYRRKVQEIRLALEAERIYTKEEILSMYMNVIYFGKGAYGIEVAAQTYFNKSADRLTLAEAALLAGVIKSPNRYSPATSMELALRRRDYVLEQMVKCGYIDETIAVQAKNEPVQLAETADGQISGWYRDAVIAEAKEILKIPTEDVLGGGYRIHTALDMAMQKASDTCVNDAEAFPADDVQCALIAVDVHTGGIRALCGGRKDDVRMALNRATEARRQPGSVIKPISVYAAAIDAGGALPSDFLDDTRRVFADGYMPRNAKDRYYGLVTMRTALSKSLNVATVSLADEIGIASARNYARRFGLPVENDDASLAFALGSMTYGVTPAEVSAAYASLANGGLAVEPHLITRIEDSSGNVIFEREFREERIVSVDTAYMITDMLQTAVSEGSAQALNGAASAVAAKTGTVSAENGTRDIWTVAYTPQISLCVWMGYDSAADGVMPESASGSGYPARMVARWLSEAKLPDETFRLPEALEYVMLDRVLLEEEQQTLQAGPNTPSAEQVREIFPKSVLPLPVSERYQTPIADIDASLETNPLGYPVIRIRVLQDNMEYLILRQQNGSFRQIAALSGTPGEVLAHTDSDLSLFSDAEYRIVVRQRGLYDQGTLLAEISEKRLTFEPLMGMASEQTDSNRPIPTMGPALFRP